MYTRVGGLLASDDAASALKIDTHGTAVAADVWQLLDAAYRLHGVRPTLLERDSHFPPLCELLHEVQRIRDAQARAVSIKVVQAAHG